MRKAHNANIKTHKYAQNRQTATLANMANNTISKGIAIGAAQTARIATFKVPFCTGLLIAEVLPSFLSRRLEIRSLAASFGVPSSFISSC